MGNLAQSEWAGHNCPGQRGHEPCGESNWECTCPVTPTPEFELKELEEKIRRLKARRAQLREVVTNGS